MNRIVYTKLPDGIQYLEFTKNEDRYILINK